MLGLLPMNASFFLYYFSDKLVSGKDVLFFGANSALMIYMGTGTIDDIDVDIWNGCIYNKENDLTMNATYYFTCKKNSLRGFQNFLLYVEVFSNYRVV